MASLREGGRAREGCRFGSGVHPCRVIRITNLRRCCSRTGMRQITQRASSARMRHRKSPDRLSPGLPGLHSTGVDMPFSITSYGAAQEVTGSCHLLEINGKQVLLDCGMHQGGDAIRRLKKERFGFNVRKITAVILSHAHLDHSGLLPMLVRKGFRGPIYCTPATRNMLAIMLKDSANIYF